MTALGDRMKAYEKAYSTTLPCNLPVIIRVDGRAFHTLTRGMEKPFDHDFIEAMQKTAKDVFDECEGAKIAYVQSDEISIVLTNDDTYETQPWFGNKLQKIVSITAARATEAFNRHMGGNTRALFDARAFVVPPHEVSNYLIWRQQDWERNSIQMLSRAHYSQKQLHKKNREAMHELLHAKGINWATLPTHLKRGTTVNKIGIDAQPPVFNTTKGRDYVAACLDPAKAPPPIPAVTSDGKCDWGMAWIGRCGDKPHVGYGRQGPEGNGVALPGSRFCAMHTRECSIHDCTKPAVAECDATFALVCGAPLCKQHLHRHHG